jgi:hypothetical protein
MFRIRVSIRSMLLSVTGLRIRATGRGVLFLLVAVVMAGSYVHSQETGSDLDVLLQQRRYIELQKMLATEGSAWTIGQGTGMEPNDTLLVVGSR